VNDTLKVRTMMRVEDVEPEGYRPVTMETERGPVLMRWYSRGRNSIAALYVGGVGGGFDTPAAGLYPRLATELLAEGIAGLRVRFRNPVDLGEAAYDVLAGVSFLESQGAVRIGLVGHSFGGAVVIRSAALSESVHTVVAISTQSDGAEDAAHLPPGCSLLLVHGSDDTVLHPSSSQWVYSIASGPKRVRIIEGGSHVLDESAEEVHTEIAEWLVGELSAQPSRVP
jgi:alpha/beta superfamily hydrolase